MGINTWNKDGPDNKHLRDATRRKQEGVRTSRVILNDIIDGIRPNATASCSYKYRTVKNEENCRSSDRDCIPAARSTSMSSLILWNISKALELNPVMDLKVAIRKAQERLDTETRDLNTVLAQEPEQQHLVCALLAWQQLGNTDLEGLYKFVEAKRNEARKCSPNCNPKPKSICKPTVSKHRCQAGSFGSHMSGPVVKLPVETKVIMRMDHSSQRQQPAKGCRMKEEKDIMSKIDAACCMESACVEQLAALDATTNELRTRAAKLARREAERVELLERAEAAWKDLEIGYQRRLTIAEEKEEDINKQIQKLISDRNGYKTGYTTLSLDLKGKGDAVDKLRGALTEVEKQIIDRACLKLKLSEDSTKGEAILAEHQCKATQLERDLQFKEDQARRKLVTLQNEADSARALSYEAERAMRAELSGLREQIGQISNELLEEDEGNVKLKTELEDLRKEKAGILEELEGCKQMCDSRMQWQITKLKEKKEALKEAKEKVLDCQCKMPVDETVEVKRTPSLAALCRCAPEDRLLESCSCTSLRSRLLSNLLADLFGGLQTELSGSGAQMPCHLLKCLEDKHNWDRASVVKTNLKNFFSKILMGELDIAIATAIENYHAKWVGTSCADAPKMQPDPDDELTEGWQQRALEKRAQRMATQMAENLFQERAEELAQRAKAIAISSGPPPCQCQPSPVPPAPPTSEAAVFPLLLKPNSPFGGGTSSQPPGGASKQSGALPGDPPAYWKRTIQDVTQLKLQIEDLKKESIKKEDLKQILDDKIAKIVKQTSATENENIPTSSKDVSNTSEENNKKEAKTLKTSKKDDSLTSSNHNKSGIAKRKPVDSNILLKRTPLTERYNKQPKRGSHGQSYAVNVCLCGPQRTGKHEQHSNNEGKQTWKQKVSKDIIPQTSSIRQTKPINLNIPSPDVEDNESKPSTQPSCNSNCKCFHKVPSNTSIDKLLETLAKWKCDLNDPFEKGARSLKISFSKYSKAAIKDILCVDSQNDSKINLSLSTISQKEQVNESDIIRNTNKDIDNSNKVPNCKQPVITESEYMGAVNLDKSNENVCKCIKNIQSTRKTNQVTANNENKPIPFKCINNNTNSCHCKIYQEMHRDHKVSQTEELKKVEIANQFEEVETKNSIELKKVTHSKSSTHVNQPNELNSTANDPSRNTELFGNNCDYYIKFLGVTLADLGSQKEKSKSRNAHTEDLISRDTYSDRRKRRQKKIHSIESSISFPKPTIKSFGSNSQLKVFEKAAKCECNAKFDEFKSFMTDVFSKQILNNNNKSKDQTLDPQNLRNNENTIESCVCCSPYKVDNSKELELNAFHLLEDHLKQKLEEFKTFSCKSSCISPEEEEKLFSAILKRVKQVISDCANEMKCGCPNSLSNDCSWNRAYGLLQEYLKIKIKRVQCSCVSSDKKDVILPDILDKVCKLIEHDFQRLKEICKCKNEARKKSVRIESHELSAKEVPERDTNIFQTSNLEEAHYCGVVKKLSKQNSNKSMILRENISSQVPPNLGMDTKSCEIVGNKNAQTTETDTIATDNKCNGIMFKTCDRSDNTYKGINDNFATNFGTKEVLVNLYRDSVKETDAMCKFRKKLKDSSISTDGESSKTLSALEINESDRNKGEDDQINREQCSVPCVGYTVDCSCDRSLGPCVCMKSVVQANNDKIYSIWKGVLANYKNYKQDFSYIMQGVHNKDIDATKSSHPIPSQIMSTDITEAVPNINVSTCSKEVSVRSNTDEIVLKDSTNINHNTTQHTTSTYEENASLATSFSNSESPLDWFECPVAEEHAKFSNAIYYPSPIDGYKKTYSDTGTEATTKSFQTCECDKVPLCHVKMLVENIEQNLYQSKCTCDSLIPRVCPIHSKKYH